MRRLRSMLRGSAFLQKWRFAPYILLYAYWSRRPIVPGRVVFLSDAREGFSGNIAFLRDELRRQAPDAEVLGIFKPRLRARRTLRDAWALPRLMASAQTIVLDDFYPVAYPIALRPETKLVQVWHAAGAFKRVGWSRVGLSGGPLPGSLAHRNYTDATVSAEGVRADYAEAFGIPVERVHAAGVPRTDAFFDAPAVESTAAAVRDRYGIPRSTKIALFAPTFRGDGQLSASYDVDSVPWTRVADSLGDEWAVIVKMHPFVAPLDVQRPGVTGVIDASRERELNDLLMAADVLVTDYSSAIFEYALLDRPIVFFCPDLEEYTASRDFYHPFESYLGGELVRDGADLAEAIRTATVGESAARFREQFMSACDGRSSERIVRDILIPPRAVVEAASVAPGGTPEPTRQDGDIRVQLVVAWLARIGLALVYAPLKLLPSSRKIVMISRENTSIPTDFSDLEAAIRRLDPSIRTVILVRMVPSGFFAKVGYAFHMLGQLVQIATARVLVVDTYTIVASVLKHKRTLTVVQIWHALGAFKKFGLSILGQDEGRDARLAHAMRMHEGYDIVLASSEHCRAAYADAFGVAPETVAVAPLPRVDRLLDPARRADVRERVYARHPQLAGARVAVYAPTFRLDGAMTTDVVDLTRALADIGYHTVVKLHPLMHGDFRETVDTAEGFTTQEMLDVADLVITDYSSAVYEAALVGIPTYFLTPDLDDYVSSRSFYLDYREDLPGPIVRTIDELTTAIRADAATHAAAEAFAKHWVQVPPARGSESTACADHIAAILTTTLD